MEQRLLNIADDVNVWLAQLSDYELLKELLECEDTIAYAVSYSIRNNDERGGINNFKEA